MEGADRGANSLSQQRAETLTGKPAARLAALMPVGILLALSAAFLFSWKPLLVKLLFADGLDAETQLALRMLLSLPFFVGYALYAHADRRRRGLPTDLSARTVVITLAIGTLYYLSSYLDFLGLRSITAGFERLILFTYPTFVTLLAWWLHRERLTSSLIASVALTYAGLAAVFLTDLHSFGPQVVLGTTQVLACSLAYAFYLLWSKGPIGRMGAPLFTTISSLSASLMLIGQFALKHPWSDLIVSAHAFWLMLGMAVGATVIPSFLMSEAIARIGPGPTSVTGGAGPIMTTLLGVWLLGEPLTVWHVLGMGLVIAGVLVLSRERR